MTAFQTPLFNKAAEKRKGSTAKTLDRSQVNRALAARLHEKIRNYEREAVRLESRGQTDAAQVLMREARKLRNLTREQGPAVA